MVSDSLRAFWTILLLPFFVHVFESRWTSFISTMCNFCPFLSPSKLPIAGWTKWRKITESLILLWSLSSSSSSQCLAAQAERSNRFNHIITVSDSYLAAVSSNLEYHSQLVHQIHPSFDMECIETEPHKNTIHGTNRQLCGECNFTISIQLGMFCIFLRFQTESPLAMLVRWQIFIVLTYHESVVGSGCCDFCNEPPEEAKKPNHGHAAYVWQNQVSHKHLLGVSIGRCAE